MVVLTHPNHLSERSAAMDRNARNVFQQRWRHVGRRMRATEAVEFLNVLTSPESLENDRSTAEYRERLYPPTVVLSMFMR